MHYKLKSRRELTERRRQIEEAFQVKEVDQAQGGHEGKKQWSKKNNKKGENNNNGGNKGKHPPCPYYSGCTNHMSFDESLFNEVNKSEVSRVRIGNGQYIEVKGKGTVAIKGFAGIGHQLTATYTPQQNGVNERKNRTIMEMARYAKREKLDQKAEYGVFVGYSSLTKGYRIVNP
ncbi:hypothetical protein CK203_086059 [Vitis vinifera]|uniref:Integrase catalytic domain-containing protein n=1 Tax=Vitis vinifera TaxID=29760 RepID=A0A438D5B0_VITVI|nr:hypothetical protein CK203_086059 [Vitis vinifera]